MVLLTTTYTNTISSMFLSVLLSLPQLPTLLLLNSEWLTASYQILADCLHKWNIEFVQPTHGLFVFARLAKNIRTAGQERSYFDELLKAGLKVSPGRSYRGKEGKFGWARIRFSVADEVMREAAAKLDAILEKQRRYSYICALQMCCWVWGALESLVRMKPVTSH